MNHDSPRLNHLLRRQQMRLFADASFLCIMAVIGAAAISLLV